MENQKRKYHRYKRGQIVLADFSPSIGSEMRNKHFAIVLSKNDSPYNGVLTVVPLTSKNKPYYIDLDDCVSKAVINNIVIKGLSLIDEVTTKLDELKENTNNNVKEIKE